LYEKPRAERGDDQAVVAPTTGRDDREGVETTTARGRLYQHHAQPGRDRSEQDRRGIGFSSIVSTQFRTQKRFAFCWNC